MNDLKRDLLDIFACKEPGHNKEDNYMNDLENVTFTASQNNEVKLSPPWVTYYKELCALFHMDPDITVEDMLEDWVIGITVYNHKKAEALRKLLPEEKTFGKVSIHVDIYDKENAKETNDVTELLQAIFDGNLSFNKVHIIRDQAGCDHKYLIMNPDIVQFFNDDLSDYCGNKTMLMEDVAFDILGEKCYEVHFCTANFNECGADDGDVTVINV